MDADLKAKWVEALRSGKYQQGRSTLRFAKPDGHRYCCLGVLCDIAAPDRWSHDGGHEWGNRFIYQDPAASVGLPDREQDRLIAMNDEGGDFAEIADVIERSPW